MVLLLATGSAMAIFGIYMSLQRKDALTKSITENFLKNDKDEKAIRKTIFPANTHTFTA